MVSLDLGGEKLNTVRGVLFTLIITLNFTFFPVLINAQNQGASGIIPEDQMLLDDPVLPDSGDQSSAVPVGDTSIWVVLRMVLVLALAALAIYGVVFFIKRLARPPQARDPNLKVLATVPLGSDTFASVISVGAKAWLVGGGTGAGVSLISEITEQEAVESMLIDEAKKSADAGTNRILDFKTLLGRFGKNNIPPDGMESHAESLRRQNDRLREFKP